MNLISKSEIAKFYKGKMLSKLYWIYYLKYPNYWPEIYRIIKRQIHNSNHKNYQKNVSDTEVMRKSALSWCKENAISNIQAISLLFGSDSRILDPRAVYPEIFNAAEQRVNECPIKMGGQANLELIFTVCKLGGIKNALETGVAYGWSTLVILLALNNVEGSCLHSVDLPYMKRRSENYVGIVIPDGLLGKWTLHKGADKDIIPKIYKRYGPFSFIHYDSDKTYAGRLWAYKKLWPLLERGGFFVSDDISDNTAFFEFSQDIQKFPIVVFNNNKYQGIIIK